MAYRDYKNCVSMICIFCHNFIQGFSSYVSVIESWINRQATTGLNVQLLIMQTLISCCQCALFYRDAIPMQTHEAGNAFNDSGNGYLILN